MATIDDKVVSMSFESSKFESGVNQAIRSLDKLKGSMQFPDAGKGLDRLGQSARNVDLSHISSGVDSVKSKLGAMSVAGLAVFANLAVAAVSAGANVVKAFALDPVLQGFDEYATNLNSIQTVLANTQSQGTNLNDVNSALQDLNRYSDKTIYNFGQMAKNIGTFTAAGVDLKTATSSIKGIANLAALSGSNAEQASSAMYQLSQAIAAGKVNMQDWISVRNAGMGGEIFQKALFDTGKAMGTIKNVRMDETFDQWKKAGNTFAKSLSETQKEAVSSTAVMGKAHKDAAKTVSDAEESSAESVQNAAQTVRDAQIGVAKDATDSAKIVKDAQKGVAEAHKQAAADIQAATQAQRDTIKQSAEDVKNALDGVREARKRLAEAMKPPSTDELQAASDNLKTAQLDQADLATAVTDAQTEQTRSAQDLAAAQKKLAELRVTPGATPEEIQAATRAVEDGQKRVTDAADAQERALLQQNAATRGVDQATQDLQKTQEKGTAKDKNVKDAQDALTVALDAYKTAQIKAQNDISAAEKKVADTRKKSVENQKAAGQKLVEAEKAQVQSRIDAGKTLADAEKAQAKTIKDAQQRVADAHTQAAEQIKQAQASLATDKGPDTWLTSDVLTNTLQQFTGDMTTAQLKAKGFNDAQIKAIQTQAKTAQHAAQDVKTLKQVMDIAKETMGSGWAKSFQLIFGDFGEAKKSFTELSTAVNGVINKSAAARNAILQDWRKLGGRKELIEGIKTAFDSLGRIMKPIKEAFREFFPATTGKSLFDLTKRFTALMEKMRPSLETVDNLKRTFRGLFALLDIGKTIIGDVFGVFKKLFNATGAGSGGFLEFTAKIGDFIVKVDKAVKSGNSLKGFFVALGGIITSPVRLLNALKNALSGLFDKFDKKSSAGASDTMSALSKAMQELHKILELVSKAWDKLMDKIGGAESIVRPIVNGMVKAFEGVGTAIGNAFRHMDFEGILAVIRTGLLFGFFKLFKDFFGKGSFFTQFGKTLGAGLTGPLQILNGPLKQLTGTMQAMQKNIKADTMMKIAIAIALLAASIVALSMIDAKSLNKAMAALGIAMAELLGAMKIMDKIGQGTGFLKMPFIAASMILLAIAVDLLVIAVRALSKLSWEELAKGLGAVAVLMGTISLAAKPLSANSAGLISAGAAMILIGAGLRVMASAVSAFGQMDLQTLGKGLGSVAISLVAIADASKLMPPNMPAIGAGLILVGAGLKILASAVKQFGEMNLHTLGIGLGSIAGSLVLISTAMDLMPPNMPLIAAGLLLVSASLLGIAGTMKIIGAMKGEDIIKSLLGIGGALGILAGGLYLMSGTVEGSAALVLAAVALDLLAPALVLMGHQSWETIIKGLVGLGGALLILGGAGALMAPIAPALLAMGAAIALIGGGLALAGVGISLIGVGFTAIAISGPAAIGILLKALEDLLAAIPRLVTQLVLGALSMVKALSDTAPAFVDALVKIGNSLLDGVIRITPKLVTAFEMMLSTIMQVIRDQSPDIIATGFQLLMDLLKGINDNIGQVTSQVIAIVKTFIDALTTKLPDLIKSGADLLVNFLKGIANNIANVAKAGLDIIVNFLTGLTDAEKLKKVVAAAVEVVVQVVNGIASKISDIVDAAGNLIISFLDGIRKKLPDVMDSARKLARAFIKEMVKTIVSLTNDVFSGIIDLLNGLADVIRNRVPELLDAMLNIGTAIIDGLIEGMKGAKDALIKWLKGLVEDIVDSITNPLGIWSPSRVFMGIGENLMVGLAQGIEDHSDKPIAAMADMGTRMTGAFTPEVTEPEITPVLNLDNIKSGVTEMNKMIYGAPSPEILQAALAVSSTGTIQAGMKAASDIAAMRQPSGGGMDRGEIAMRNRALTYIQNNYSPEALSEVEIYRQTKNQISMIQRAVDDPTLQMR